MINATIYTLKKVFRISFIILCLFLVLASLTIYFAPRFFNTDAFKHNIESVLMTKLQRIVHIRDVSVSFFPDIHIQLSGITVSDIAGFSRTPQIQGQSAEMYLEVWPLLEKQFVIKRISIRGFFVKLTRLANGKNNWSDLLNLETKPKGAKKQKLQKSQMFSIQTHLNIAMTDTNVEINDQQNNRHLKLSHLEYLSTGHIQSIIHMGFDMTVKLPVKDKVCYIDTHTELDGRACLLLEQGRYSINDAHLKINATGLFPDDHFVESHLKAKIALSYEHKALELSDMQLDINDVFVQGNIYARDFFKSPAISGQLNIHTQNLMNTLSFLPKKVGFNGPVHADILFQTRGNTMESIIKNSEIEIHTKTGSGNFVLLDFMSDKNNYILKQANLNIHLLPLEKNQKTGFQYGFQTKLGGNIISQDSLLDLTVNTQSHVLFGPDLWNICINNGDFNIQAICKKLSDAPYVIQGNLAGNLKTQRGIIKNVSIAGPLINGQLTTEIITQNKKPAIQSHINVSIDQVKKVAQAFSLPMPKFHDPTAGEKIAFDGDILLTSDYMQLSNMTFNIDEAEIVGKVIYQYHPLKMNYDLTTNHLNLDRHWIHRSTHSHSHSHSHSKSSAKEALEINGTIQYNDFRIYNVSIDQMRMNYSVKENVYRFSPIYGQMYGGTFNGHWTFDYSPRIPRSSLLIHCDSVQIEPFLKDYYQFDRIVGLLNMKASLSWDLKGSHMIRSSINGNAKLELSNGIINGIQIVPNDVKKQALEIHNKQSLEIPKQQYLDKMTGLARFRNGCMYNSDLMAYAKGLRLKGKGYLDIAKKEVDYTFYVGIAHFPIIPYQVKGPVGNVTTNLDTSEFLKIAVSDFFNQAGKLSSETIKDTIEFSGKALDLNTEPLKETVDKSSETIKKTIDKSSGTIKDTLSVGADIINSGKEAFQSLGNRLNGFFFGHNGEKSQ
jgi:hypothetical protein